MEPPPLVVPLTWAKNKLFLPSKCYSNRLCKLAAYPVQQSGNRLPPINTAVLPVHKVKEQQKPLRSKTKGVTSNERK